MKKISLLILLGIALVACTNKSLSKEEARAILTEKKKFPIIHSYQIYTKDSEDGRKLLDAGLEKEGLVKVERNRKTGDNHAPVIQFTDKAKAYLLAPDKGQLSSVQKVKIAEEVMDSLSSLAVNEKGAIASAVYTTKYINVNPFSKLDKKDYNQKKTYKAKFILTKEGWILE